MSEDDSVYGWACAPIDLSMSGVNCVVTASDSRTNSTELTDSTVGIIIHADRRSASNSNECSASRAATYEASHGTRHRTNNRSSQ